MVVVYFAFSTKVEAWARRSARPKICINCDNKLARKLVECQENVKSFSTVSFYKRTTHEPLRTALAPSSLFRVGKIFIYVPIITNYIYQNKYTVPYGEFYYHNPCWRVSKRKTARSWEITQ